MALKNEITLKIKEEILNDPQNVGYAGKSDVEITKLLNEPIKRSQVIFTEELPPIVRLLAGINTANIVSEQDVIDSKSI